MNDLFPALAALEQAAKQTKPLSVEQRLQLTEIRQRLQELTVAAGNSTAVLAQVVATQPADSALRGESRTIRRLHLAVSNMVRTV
ncbi:hypothetical protein [Stenotrophomonas oahuensis]|uniref:Uncharacterized protein n=1 Tax=Stenotrophomonas oahuensis TaxID=3003271 RepID=A0ABY9YUZ6_9GAMM|nr:hypothetical protein [Stenotrophomonas sp. A5586]WNH54814.1 hypothetical protein PDM29_20940 [Stenotrophomonas sp. A5586]